jgi:carbon monoxide dehydrogenase subunit G
MRIAEKVIVDAPCEVVWEYIAEPDNYPDFMVGLSRWEVAGPQRNGLGARYRVLIRIGAADIGGLVEIVEWNPGRDMALTSVTGLDQPSGSGLPVAEDGYTRLAIR